MAERNEKATLKVSVILPTYQREKELGRALDSLAKQRFDQFEIILVDDNDCDVWNTKVKEIVNAFNDSYRDIPLFYIQNHPNLGSAKARNAGIQAAHGEFITFLDDDDIYYPDKIKKQYSFMISEELDYSITDLNLYFDDDKPSEYRTRDYIKKTDKDSLLRYHFMHHMTGTDTMMFKKDYLMKIGGFAPIDMGDEFYLMQRAIEGEGKFGYLKGCDMKAFVHRGEGGLSSGQTKIDGENRLFEYKKEFFSRFDKKSIRYIKMRHHAVLAFAYLRMGKYKDFMIEAVKSLMASPLCCLGLFLGKR